jgi:hypothetical protein
MCVVPRIMFVPEFPFDLCRPYGCRYELPCKQCLIKVMQSLSALVLFCPSYDMWDMYVRK